MVLPAVETRTMSNSLRAQLDDIKTGKTEDRFGWMVKL
jgi:hypothetical protein